MQVKETATRMLTNFSVQAGTNDFYTAQRLFKDVGATALPQVCAQYHSTAFCETCRVSCPALALQQVPGRNCGVVSVGLYTILADHYFVLMCQPARLVGTP